MTLEGKAVSRAVLTVFIYALTSFFSLGESIFPFPLNEIIFFIVAIYFSTIHFKKHPFYLTIILLTGFIGMFSSEFYWELILNSDTMMSISEQEIPSKFKLAYQIGLIIWMILTFLQHPVIKIQLLGLIPVSLILTGIFVQLPLYEILGLGCMFIYSILNIKQNPLLYLWILLFILECTKLWHLTSLR